MVTFAQLQNMDTSKLSTAAATAGDLSGTLSTRASQVQSSADIPPEMWQGQDASAASKLMSPLDSPLYDVSDSAKRSQAVLEDLTEALKNAQEDLKSAVSRANAEGFMVASDGTVTPPPTSMNGSDNSVEFEQARQLTAEIQKALEKAEEADERAQGILGDKSTFGKAVSGATGGGAPSWVDGVGNLAGDFKDGLSQLGRASTIAEEFVKDPAGRATLKGITSKTGAVGAVLTGGLAALDQAQHDSRHNPEIGPGEGFLRAGGRGVLEGGGSFAGSVGGAALGGAAGAATGAYAGPVGAVVGAGVGGVVGGAAGGDAGQDAGQWLSDQIFGEIAGRDD